MVTVRKLIELLQTYDPDAVVVLDKPIPNYDDHTGMEHRQLVDLEEVYQAKAKEVFMSWDHRYKDKNNYVVIL